MLTDQTFTALPIAVIGPELFYSSRHALRYNLETVFRFRDMQNFIFIYAALENSKYGPQKNFFRQLLSMGAAIQQEIIVKADALVDDELRKNIGKLFLSADLIYSPEFVEAFTKNGVPFTNRRNYKSYPSVFVDGLVHFAYGMIPFSSDTFMDYYSSHCPTPT
jgi:hypothetical protein